MTNHWVDLKNSDVILIMGSNAAENHPISFKWVMKAVDNGGTLIHVDPRFTRTSAKANIYARLRSGTDIAFLGGMIKYILDNDLINKQYVTDYTNAANIINAGFSFSDGIFSGYDPAKKKYDKATWTYQLDENGIPLRDETLQHPMCAYQLLKKHYSRYDLDKVSAVTGMPKEDLLKVYKAYAATGQTGKAGTVMYAMGWTQHTVGVQNIRAMSIIQLLLGNMGVAGGGVNALRGESNVQGSTDHGLLYHIITGYLKTPVASAQTLADYLKKFTPVTNDPKSLNWWSNTPKYMVSFLKAYYGDAATKENDFGYAMMPKIDDGVNYSWLVLFDEMAKGKFKGFFAWGQNPACSSANANKVRRAMGNLDWMVNVNIFDNETGSFWKGPGMDPKKVKTEVFMLPCAVSVEKEGSLANSGRWTQWRYKAANPPGEAMADGDIIFELFNKIRELYRKEGGKYPDPILKSTWDFTDESGHFSTTEVAKQINGKYTVDVVKPDGTSFKKGAQVASFPALMDDGSTSCGVWIYCGSFTDAGNMMARRNNEDKSGIGLYSEWSWSWPLNRRIIYNRASVDKNGEPFDKEHPVIKWDAAGAKWIGDIADNAAPPLSDPKGKLPFIMNAEGYGRLFGGFTLADGPFPEHYEPLECPVTENPFSKQMNNPTLRIFGEEGENAGDEGKDFFLTCDSRYPIVCSTYRVSEHWQTGLMTRWNKQLIELQPQNIVELSPELAKEKGIKSGDKVIIKSARGKIETVAIVTSRFKPFVIHGKTIHQIGTTWHYGWITPKDGGDSCNLLVPTAGDPNTFIPESKAFMVNIERKG